MFINRKKFTTKSLCATALLAIPVISMAAGSCGDLIIDFTVPANAPHCQLVDVLINKGYPVAGKIPNTITHSTSSITLRQYTPTPIVPRLVTPNLKIRYQCGTTTYTLSSRQSASSAMGGPGKIRAESSPKSPIEPTVKRGKCPFVKKGSAGHIVWTLRDQAVKQ